MPYDSNADLPAYVKKLPAGKQSQWRKVFNSCVSGGGDEGKCFRMANGVVKKEFDDFEHEGEAEPPDSPELKQAIKDYYYDVNVEGEVVASDIEEPIWVVGEASLHASAASAVPGPGLITRLAALFSGGTNKSATPKKAVTGAFAVVKQSDGKYRWFARYSNSWLDKDGEIITEEAHKEYINWAYDTGTFPELWMWHTPGTRIGEADWLDFSNGFAHASGIIDEGRESVVSELGSKDAGVSHGFLSLQSGKYIQRYRTYEISVLPRERAAVETTGFNVLDALKEGEVVMAFTDEKRKWLTDALGEEAVAKLEKSTDAMADQLKQLGVEYKEAEQQAAEENESQSEGFKALADQVANLTTTVGQLAGVVAQQQKQLGEVQKSDDEKIEDAFLARVAKAFGQNGGGVRPTESAANVEAASEKAAAPQPDFFSGMIAEQFGMVAKQVPAGPVGSTAVAAVNVDDGSQGPVEVRG
jgi:cation transport regulator ChaB